MASGKKGNIRLRIAAAAGGLTALTAAMSAFTCFHMKKEFGRGVYPDRRFSNQNRYDPDYSSRRSRTEVSFRSGKNTLRGYIYGTENKVPKGLIVFAHGITVGHESYINQLMWFADRGWRVFAYDATGSCTSEGSGTVGLVQSALDLDRALTFAESSGLFRSLPIYLLGHSWGGYAVCAALNFCHDVIAAVSLSGYADAEKMLTLGTERIVGKVGTKIFMPFVNAYNRAVFGKYATLSAVDGINSSGLPVLVMHGEHDEYVDFERVSIYSQRDRITNPNAEFRVLKGRYADHQNFFKCDEANDYLQSFYRRRDELTKKYGGKIPDERHIKLVRSFDKSRINMINTELLEQIEDFFLEHPDPRR